MPNVGDEILIRANFRDRLGEPADPTTVVSGIAEPNGNVEPITLLKVGLGEYEGLFIVNMAGEHWCRIEGTGAVTVVEERKFSVPVQKVVL